MLGVKWFREQSTTWLTVSEQELKSKVSRLKSDLTIVELNLKDIQTVLAERNVQRP